MRILVLSSSTGGGHDMRARSIEQWNAVLSKSDATTTIDRYQALEESAGIYKFGVALYNLIQKKWPRLHHLYFNWLEVFQVSAHENLLLGKKRFIQVLEKTRPDVIISVHAHTNHAFRAIAKRTLPQVRFVTYCGEMFGGYGYSRHWVDPKADAFIGATKEICTAAEKLGMPAKKIRYGGFLLNPKFYAAPLTPAKKEQLCVTELELAPDKFTILLSTGANGAQNHPAFITALEKAKLPIQVIALCGRDQAAQPRLTEMEQELKYVTVKVLGYRDDMFALMQICHAIVARPGTGTTCEAIMAGCPLLLNTLGGIMPQEWITVKYLRAAGLEAKRLKRPEDLARQITELTEAPDKLDELEQKMTALRPNAQPAEIFDYLVDLVDASRSL